MCLRWTATSMLEAERQFRKIIGNSELAVAVERDVAARRATKLAHTTTATAAPDVATAIV